MLADALKVNQSLQNLRSATTEYSMVQYKKQNNSPKSYSDGPSYLGTRHYPFSVPSHSHSNNVEFRNGMGLRMGNDTLLLSLLFGGVEYDRPSLNPI